MNFNNQLKDEDRRLVHLLKKQILESPSDHLVEDTMARFSTLQANKKFVHKPLRIPLYIMVSIVVLLMLPFFVPMVPNGLYLNPLSELLSYPESSILNYTVWCWLAAVALWISRLLLQIKSKSDLSPFKI